MPFTTSDFINIFKAYNTSVFPFQIVLFASAIYIIYLVIRLKKYSNKVVTGILIFYWLWNGIVYHILFFSSINPAAYAFGFVFIIQAALFYKAGIMDKNLVYEISNDLKTYTGALFILYALIIYPILGYTGGHIYPSSPTFGLPCPTVIFTFGILLWAKNKIPFYILAIPIIWSIIGISAAINLGIKEDFGLIISALIGSTLIILGKIKERKMIKV